MNIVLFLAFVKTAKLPIWKRSFKGKVTSLTLKLYSLSMMLFT